MNLSSSNYFDAMLYGARDNEVSDYFMQKVDTLQQIIPEQYQTLYNDIRENATFINSDYMKDVTSSLLSHVGSMWKGDGIRPLTKVADMQAAPPSMRRWIMAEPTIRKAYHAQECDGYSNSYIDMEPNSIGEDHSDYRKVRHGIIHVEENEEVCSVYHSDMFDDDYAELTIGNKVDIMTTWDMVKNEYQKGRLDPTSSWATYL